MRVALLSSQILTDDVQEMPHSGGVVARQFGKFGDGRNAGEGRNAGDAGDGRDGRDRRDRRDESEGDEGGEGRGGKPYGQPGAQSQASSQPFSQQRPPPQWEPHSPAQSPAQSSDHLSDHSPDQSHSLPRGFNRILGQTILRRQLDLALALGCERILCLGDRLEPEILELQHLVEGNDLSFHLIRDMSSFPGLTQAADEILVIADGLSVDFEQAGPLFAHRKLILTLPADYSPSAHFERIDKERDWAGIMLVPGEVVERLSELPDDVDLISAILRIALQSGVPTKPLPAQILEQGHWKIIATEAERRDQENVYLAQTAPEISPFAPVTGAAIWASTLVARVVQRGAHLAYLVFAIQLGLIAASVVLVSYAEVSYALSLLLLNAFLGDFLAGYRAVSFANSRNGRWMPVADQMFRFGGDVLLVWGAAVAVVKAIVIGGTAVFSETEVVMTVATETSASGGWATGGWGILCLSAGFAMVMLLGLLTFIAPSKYANFLDSVKGVGAEGNAADDSNLGHSVTSAASGVSGVSNISGVSGVSSVSGVSGRAEVSKQGNAAVYDLIGPGDGPSKTAKKVENLASDRGFLIIILQIGLWFDQMMGLSQVLAMLALIYVLMRRFR